MRYSDQRCKSGRAQVCQSVSGLHTKLYNIQGNDRFSFVVPTAVTSVSEVTDFSSAKSEITSASGFLSSARISLTHFLNQHAMELRREDQSLTRFLTCFKKRFR